MPADYDAAKLAEKWAAIRTAGSTTSAEDRVLFDMAVTVSAMRLLQSLHWGRVDPRHVGFDYDVTSRRLDLATTLRSARDGAGLPAAIAAVEPQFPVYRRMIKALGDYRSLAAAEPPSVPAPGAGRKKVEPGKPWDGVTALAARLRAFGDLLADAAAPQSAADGTPLYDGPLVDAVKVFQRRHGLEPDGVIGAGTIEKMNVPAAARVRQLELALERERWLPEMRKEPLLFVNVSLFRLWAHDPERPDEPLRMNVVAGKSIGHETPIFIDEMEYVIFRPYWSPPPSIIRSEIVPHARRDASYLGRQNMEIVASGDEGAPALPATRENLDRVAAGKLYVRQKPGEKNSLGLAKFIFPNSENIYMHGTPAQALFARARRDFSHGCIRLEFPARLARVGAAARPAVDRGAHRGGDERLAAHPGEPEAEAQGDHLLRHRLRGLEGRRALRRRLLRPRREAGEGARGRISLPAQRLRARESPTLRTGGVGQWDECGPFRRPTFGRRAAGSTGRGRVPESATAR